MFLYELYHDVTHVYKHLHQANQSDRGPLFQRGGHQETLTGSGHTKLRFSVPDKTWGNTDLGLLRELKTLPTITCLETGELDSIRSLGGCLGKAICFRDGISSCAPISRADGLVSLVV